jgi:hypothetical protein
VEERRVVDLVEEAHGDEDETGPAELLPREEIERQELDLGLAFRVASMTACSNSSSEFMMMRSVNL